MFEMLLDIMYARPKERWEKIKAHLATLFFWLTFFAWFPATLVLYFITDDYNIPFWGFLILWFFFTFALIGTGFWATGLFTHQPVSVVKKPRDWRTVCKSIMRGVGQYFLGLFVVLGLIILLILAAFLDYSNPYTPWINCTLYLVGHLGLLLVGGFLLVIAGYLLWQLILYWMGSPKSVLHPKGLKAFPWPTLILFTLAGLGFTSYAAQELYLLWTP